jgi:indolepyruvate ferredoxin oxidoreductase beta subunit
MSTLRKLGADGRRPITIAVLAMGGQGGGVLVDWIVDLARHNGYLSQATSVPGVAQRTGATIYYIELFAQAHAQAKGQAPVLALMPVPGEVDIVIAAELMEAGRAMLRGLVSAGRTTLIASCHRDYATDEKVVPGNGVADAQAVLEAATKHAQRFICDDMQALARQSGSVISAALFGGLAGCDELPFDDAAFEATIERAGVGVEASLRAFHAAARAVRHPLRAEGVALDPMETAPQPLPARAASDAVEPLRARIERDFPPVAHAMLGAGLQRVIEFQDLAYAEEYLDRMADLHAHALRCGDAAQGHVATTEAARWVAVAMSYDDIIRVADLKARAQRFARVRNEVGAGAGEVVGMTDYFHPRLEEVYGLLPPALVGWIEKTPLLRAGLVRAIGKGRRLRPHTVRGQLMLQALAGLRRWRRRSTRHLHETAHLQRWLEGVKSALTADYGLGLELIRCRRLVKGYSDTHARGTGKFDRLQRAAELLQGRARAAEELALLRQAALADPQAMRLKEQWRMLGLPEQAPLSPAA